MKGKKVENFKTREVSGLTRYWAHPKINIVMKFAFKLNPHGFCLIFKIIKLHNLETQYVFECELVRWATIFNISSFDDKTGIFFPVFIESRAVQITGLPHGY